MTEQSSFYYITALIIYASYMLYFELGHVRSYIVDYSSSRTVHRDKTIYRGSTGPARESRRLTNPSARQHWPNVKVNGETTV